MDILNEIQFVVTYFQFQSQIPSYRYCGNLHYYFSLFCNMKKYEIFCSLHIGEIFRISRISPRVRRQKEKVHHVANVGRMGYRVAKTVLKSDCYKDRIKNVHTRTFGSFDNNGVLV